MANSGREHPVLGRVQWNAGLDSWETEVELTPGRRIRFAIIAEAQWAEVALEELFAVGAEFLDWARQAESECRERIADNFLGVYNSAWADDDPDEGPPPLDRPGFIANLRLAAISLYHDGSADWMYDPGTLFAGHGVLVDMGNDRVFGRASLVG